MAYDTQDQQEMDNFKHFWNSWGKWLFTLLILAGLGYIGWTVYQSRLQTHREDASLVLHELSLKVEANDLEGAKAKQAILQKDFSDTVSATQGALVLSGVIFEAGKYDEAKTYLEWVQKNSQEPVMLALATRSLSHLYLQQKKYDEALAVLKFKLDPVFEGLVLESRGDIFAAQNKSKEAQEAYELALAKTPEGPGRDFIELKRNQQRP